VKRTRWLDALSGALAAALALGVSELLAGIFPVLPSLVEGIGNWVIDNVPTPVKDWAIATFGTNDKLALLVGISLVTLVIGALVGMAARRGFTRAVVGFVGFGSVGALLASLDPAVSLALAIIPGGAAALAGLGSLQLLSGLTAPRATEGETTGDSRRRFILGAGAVLGVAVASAAVGRNLLTRARRVIAGREDVVLPLAAMPRAEVTAANDLAVEGLSPILVPNDDFYRIDTAFAVPRVDVMEWTLSVSGMVDRPYQIDYYDLLDMRMVEMDITLSCVSNEIGGNLVGNARWLGVPLYEILDRAGVDPDAEQVVGRSVDEFTVGFPVEAVYDGREAMLAVGMNDEPLPIEHGFPARLVVAGLYGYVSATKWLSSIELTRWDDFDAYWVPRGWSKEGPIKTQSRIDTPAARQRVSPGPRSVAGVAWAPSRGISKVEVQLGEDAAWIEAELSDPLSISSWVQWRVPWEATVGEHLIRVRATDGTGELQDEQIRRPAPDGATGWHTLRVFVQEA
jgi:DMSO/TMAO reductase YedYZ molybdopterin-dependent catalytic subunit